MRTGSRRKCPPERLSTHKEQERQCGGCIQKKKQISGGEEELRRELQARGKIWQAGESDLY